MYVVKFWQYNIMISIVSIFGSSSVLFEIKEYLFAKEEIKILNLHSYIFKSRMWKTCDCVVLLIQAAEIVFFFLSTFYRSTNVILSNVRLNLF